VKTNENVSIKKTNETYGLLVGTGTSFGAGTDADILITLKNKNKDLESGKLILNFYF